jgi:hypothetical protein
MTDALCPTCDEPARPYKDDRFVCVPCVNIWTVTTYKSDDTFYSYQCVYCLTKYWGSYFGLMQICPKCNRRQPDAKGGK